MAQWIQSNIDQGAPAGARNTELFEAELKSILEGTEFNLTEVEKITIQQLAPKLAEPEKPAKPVKEIDWNAQGEHCPICGRLLSQENYEHLKKKFGRYDALFK
jgi:tRNA(Ile2) C34 agmatinyltransferase TiaS